ncbi:MAG: exodeoxyribonuclease V subunit gamma [Chthoniobacterales bacterium]|nr:exodeoxyribonuclease V subunit gamma [Chthoniobacterales bacterium]
MSGLYLHTSNRLEKLFADLAEIVAQPSGDIFRPETIVVQSLGMGRWLSLRLAEAHGICANVRFPFPQKFVSEIFRETLPEVPASDAFDRDLLPWRVMRLLPGLLTKSEFQPVRHYLAGERAELKLYQLSNKIAEVFDRYLAFRPRMILDWDAGKDGHWQAVLWRKLARAETHQPMLAERLAEKLQASRGVGHLPPRVSIFGLSTLPGFYLDIVQAIARQSEVHLFVMEPTDQWWRDIVSVREEARVLKRQPGRTAAELHLERGNSLLASMGKLGRDFLGLVGDLEPVRHQESFIELDRRTLLSQVQRDIFRLREREATMPFLPNDDKSIQFHSCHSPMREMEVLHDQLLDVFENDSSLEPRDVVVMMPDVASYAPFIEAVFDTPESEAVRIPFTIADRAARAESGVIDTFLSILDLSTSRFGASSVLSVLESPSVQRRFNLTESDLATIRVWLDKAAIRWGIDAAHREEFGVPAFTQNSWREGLDRLLLGYAMPAGGRQLFHGILPIDEVEGGLAEILGDFIEFTDVLFHTVAELKAPRSLCDWQAILRQIVERFFTSTEEVARELLQVRHVLESLGTVSREAAFTEAVSFDVLLAHLNRVLGDSDSGSGFVVGRVTFCALKPMRSIPFKVICLVGMDDTSYPRKSSAVGFDLIAQDPRPGDRFPRDEDRYLFLEALLSARQLFYVSYVGQSIRDNSSLPPSVLVSELLDYLGDESAPDSLVVRHRLQPFNPEYFGPDGKLFSYSAESCRASSVARGVRANPPPFVSQPIAEPDDEWRAVELERLCAFFRNPAQVFLRDRLGIRLPREEAILEDREPFVLANLSKYKINQDLLAHGLAGGDLGLTKPVVRAGGQLPPGHLGDSVFRTLCLEAEAFVATVGPHAAAAPEPSVEVNLDFDQWKLNGRIDGLKEGGLLHYRLAKLQPKDMLRTWISHLALNCSAPTSATLIGQDLMQFYRPVKGARAILRDLLELYSLGLRIPLPFFPQSSYAYAAQVVRPVGKEEALVKARRFWEGDRNRDIRSESDNAYLQLAFRNVDDPLGPEWQAMALRIFQPLLEAVAETKL